MPGTSASAAVILGHFEYVHERIRRRIVMNIEGSRIDHKVI